MVAAYFFYNAEWGFLLCGETGWMGADFQLVVKIVLIFNGLWC